MGVFVCVCVCVFVCVCVCEREREREREAGRQADRQTDRQTESKLVYNAESARVISGRNANHQITSKSLIQRSRYMLPFLCWEKKKIA